MLLQLVSERMVCGVVCISVIIMISIKAHASVKIPPIEQTNKRNGVVIGISKLSLNI